MKTKQTNASGAFLLFSKQLILLLFILQTVLTGKIVKGNEIVLSDPDPYCYPTYHTNNSDWDIEQLEIPEISFTYTLPLNGSLTINNHLSTIIRVKPGENYTFRIRTDGWIGVGVAVDFNNDGDFDDPGEILASPTYHPADLHTYNYSVTIPAEVVDGNYRLRLWNEGGNAAAVHEVPRLGPCGSFIRGMYADFTLAVTDGKIKPDANGILYVAKGGAGVQTGYGWNNAVSELAIALKAAATDNTIEQIWVAGGTYKPLYSPRNGADFADEGRDNAFLLVKDVKVYGGFAGTETTIGQRNLGLLANASILSGDFDGNDMVTGSGSTLTISGNDENAYHVVISAGEMGTAQLDGFTVKGGNASGSGFFQVNGEKLERDAGGGIRSSTSNASYRNLFVAYNNSLTGGGIASTHFSNEKYTNIVVAHNQSIGFYTNGSSNSILTNATFYGNSGAGALGVDGSELSLRNSIIVAHNNGVVVSSGTIKIDYSIVKGDWGGTGNLDVDPHFVDADAGDYALLATSPAVNAGSNGLFAELDANTLDKAGNVRVYQHDSGGVIDMGAYEFQGDAIAAVMSVSVPADDTYEIGDELEFVVAFSHPVPVSTTSGTPNLPLLLGTDHRMAEYVSGSGTKNLIFRYSVKPGDQAPSGVSLGTSIVDGNLGTTILTLNGIPATGGILVDGGSVPVFTSTPIESTAYGQPYEYSITATGDEVLPTTLTAEVLPDWLDFRLAEASLSGTPDKSHLGDHPVTIRATNVIGYTDQTFTIRVVDETAPVISGSSPADEATGIDPQPTLSLTFDEEVGLGATGTLKLMNGATVLRNYDLSVAADRSLFSLSEDQLTVSWTVDADLPLNTLIGVEISTGFVKDLSGNDFAGITKTEWSFTTINIHPNNQGILFVSKGGNGNQTGNSWANAVGELADALKAATFNTDIQQIWVASGTYAPMYSPRDGANFADEIEDNSFLLVKDVEIYGGFEGTEALLTDRDPKKLLFEHATYLDGILYHSTQTSKIHARHVVISAGDVGSAKLDGFFITNGNSLGASGSITANEISNISRADGAGLYLRASSPKLSNLYIHNNKAQSSGGGMVNTDGSSPDINNVVFFSNETYNAHGGAIANFDNTAPQIKNTYIIGNIARGNGGAVYNGNSSSPLFLNSTIYGNASLTGGMHNVGANIEFQNSIILENYSTDDLSNPSQIENFDTVNVINASSTVTYKYSFVQGSSAGWADLGTDGGNNIDGDLVFQNTFQLTENSPVIGKGSNPLYQAGGGDPENDLDVFGNPRIFNSHAGGNIDIGAEEFQSLIAPVLSNFANISKTFGDADFTLTAPTSSSTGSITYSSSDTDVATVDGNTVTIIGVGTTTITASQSGTGDYLAGDIELELTVNKALLEITAEPATKVYGADDPALTYSVNGYQYADDANIFSGSLERDAGENVGTYAITQGSLAAGDNYDISFTADQLLITKATLNIAADPQTKVYGAADPALTYSVSGYQGSDDENIITGSLSRNAGENVGTYAINQGNVDAGGNYEINFTADQLIITKATLNVVAQPQTKVYGTADPALTYSVTGYQYADDADIFSGSLERVAGENIGNYDITQGSLAAGGNYDINFTADQLQITKATLNVVADPQTKVYGAADPALTYSVTGYQHADNESIITGALARDAGENVGNYAITQGSLDAGANYNIAYVRNDLTITAATRSLTFPTLPEKTFGDPDFSPGASSSTGEPITYTSNNPQVAEIIDGNIRIIGAGTATITATLPQNSNYAQLPTASQQLTVHKAQQIITLSGPTEVRRDAGSIALQVASSSGLAVTLSVDDPLVATIRETSMQIHRLGTVIITADQPGNNNYLPATPVSLTVRVVQASEVEQDPKSDGDDIAIRVHPAMSPNGDGINDFLIIEGIRDFPENKVTLFNRNGTILWQANGYNNSTVVFKGISSSRQKLPSGTYFYIVEVRDGNVWKAKKSYFMIRY